MLRSITLCTILALASATAAAQSFNVDIGNGLGVPAATFGGAADRPGTWNAITGTGLGPFPLVNLSGAATSATVTRSTGTGGGFFFNNANTTGDFQALLDDGHDVGGTGAMVTYTISGLAAGDYTVYAYAVAPDSATFLTNVSVTGSPSMNPQTVGGAIPVNAFALGITHSVHVVTVPPASNLVITFATSSGFGTANGFQICNDYSCVLRQPGGAGSPLEIANRCGEPGAPYYTVATLVAGSFPNGPIFGIDISLNDVAAQLSAGPPFSGILDAQGQATFTLPGVPPGITIYFVSGSFRGQIFVVTPPMSYTTI
jgi:hypothetical protein